MKKLLIAISMFLMLLFSVLAVGATVLVDVDSNADDDASNPKHDDDDQHNINGTVTVTGADSSCEVKPAVGYTDALIGSPVISDLGVITNLRIPETVPIVYVGDEDDDVESQVFAEVYCGASGTIETIALEREAKLVIKKVEASYGEDTETLNKDGDEITDILPGTIMKLEVILENNFDKDANNEIDVDVKLSCDSNDIDIDDDKDDVTISEDDEDSLDFELDFQEDDVESKKYTCTVLAEGTDENGAKHSASWDLDFEVERERNEVLIKDFSVNPESITCDSREVSITTKVKNTGEKDDDEVKLEVSIPKLNYKKDYVDLDLDSTDDTRKSFIISIPESARSGKYEVVAKTYVKGVSLSDTKVISINVPKCGQDPVVVKPQAPVVVVPEPVAPVDVTPVTPSADNTSAMEEEEEVAGNGMVIALIVLIVLLIAGIVGLLIYLFKA